MLAYCNALYSSPCCRIEGGLDFGKLYKPKASLSIYKLKQILNK
jgi:hypothetical protein